MDSIDLDTSNPSASELVARAEDGEVVLLTRGGKPVARITAVEQPAERPREPLDVDALKALTDSMTDHGTSAVDLIREMRDSRY